MRARIVVAAALALTAPGVARAQAVWPNSDFFHGERPREGRLYLCGQAVDTTAERAKAAALLQTRRRVVEKRTQAISTALQAYGGTIATDPTSAATVEVLSESVPLVVRPVGARFEVSLCAGYPLEWVFEPHVRLVELLEAWPEKAEERGAWFFRASHVVEAYQGDNEPALALFTATLVLSKPNAPTSAWIKASDLNEQLKRFDEARAILKKALDRPNQPPPDVMALGMRIASSLEAAGRTAGGPRVIEGLRAASSALQEILPGLPADFADRPRVETRIVELRLEESKLLEQQGGVAGLNAAAEVLSLVLAATSPGSDDRPRVFAQLIELHLKLAKLHEDQGTAEGKQADGLDRAEQALRGLLSVLPVELPARRRVEVSLKDITDRKEALRASWPKLSQELQLWVKARQQPREQFHVTFTLRARKLEMQATGAKGRTVAFLWLDQDGLYRYHVLAPDQRGVLTTPELPRSQAYIVAIALPADARPGWLEGPEELCARRKVDERDLKAVAAFRAAMEGDQLWAVGYELDVP